jgi:hypothetical protein
MVMELFVLKQKSASAYNKCIIAGILLAEKALLKSPYANRYIS